MTKVGKIQWKKILNFIKGLLDKDKSPKHSEIIKKSFLVNFVQEITSRKYFQRHCGPRKLENYLQPWRGGIFLISFVQRVGIFSGMPQCIISIEN